MATAEYLSADDIAQRLGVHKSTVWNWRFILPEPVRDRTGRPVWALAEITQWMRDRQSRAGPDRGGSVSSAIGDPPCDACRHVKRCAQTGEACRAFKAYFLYGAENRWRNEPRQPRRDIGMKLGFTQRLYVDFKKLMPWERERLNARAPSS